MVAGLPQSGRKHSPALSLAAAHDCQQCCPGPASRLQTSSCHLPTSAKLLRGTSNTSATCLGCPCPYLQDDRLALAAADGCMSSLLGPPSVCVLPDLHRSFQVRQIFKLDTCSTGSAVQQPGYSWPCQAHGATSQYHWLPFTRHCPKDVQSEHFQPPVPQWLSQSAPAGTSAFNCF